MSLLDIDNQFNKQYNLLLNTQMAVFDQVKNYPFDLTKREITDAILSRMDANWAYLGGVNGLLGRQKNPSSADYFTEACLFFIKAYFDGTGGKYQVRSEFNVKIERSRKIVKPDISIWEGPKLVGVIELKTLNDWFRNSWKQDLESREVLVKSVSNSPDLFFAVVAHWNFFDESAPEFNTKYFGLRRKKINTCTEATIENLILAFLASQKY